jgi:hypothetical protein
LIVPKTFKTKIVGVTRKNEDGTIRQELLEALETGEVVTLERDPFNEYDENAIEVHNAYGEQLGFLGKRLAADLSPKLDSGMQASCVVTEVTNGSDDEIENGIYGCNIEITLFSAEEWNDQQSIKVIQEINIKQPILEQAKQVIVDKKEEIGIFKSQPVSKPKAIGCLSVIILPILLTALIKTFI